MTKAGAQRVAAEKGLIIVAPDTSPSKHNVYISFPYQYLHDMTILFFMFFFHFVLNKLKNGCILAVAELLSTLLLYDRIYIIRLMEEQ